MDSGSPVNRSSKPLRLDIGELGRPVAAKAAPHDGDPPSVHIAAHLEIVHGRGEGSLRARILAEQRIFASSRHIDREGSETQLVQRLAVGPPILLPSVHAAPMHHHRRANRSFWNLQVSDNLPTLEGNLDPFERRIEVGSSF